MPPAPTAEAGTRVGLRRNRLRSATAAMAVLVTTAVFATACASSGPGAGADGTGSTSGGRTSPGSSAAPDVDHGGTAGSFTADFAKCMRGHGVPAFPDPNGQAGQLGPSSGIDPNSAAFQSAVNGPCKSLAPPAWLSSASGPDSVPAGGE
jgi:hypothetical protein